MNPTPLRTVRPGRRPSLALRAFLLAVVTILTGTAFLTTAAPATAAPSSFVTFSWSQGQPTKQLLPTNEHVCVLTRVGGNFRGASESVRLYQEGGWWKLGGSSVRDGVHAAAACYRRSSFTTSSTDGNWLSSEQTLGWRTGTKCLHRKLNGEPGDAATYLTGLAGNFAGIGEYGWIWQAERGFPSRIELNACQDRHTYYVRAHAFVAGKWGTFAKFIGPNDTYGQTLDNDKTFGGRSSLGAGPLIKVMARTDRAMCYLKGIQGKLRSGAEYAKIEPVTFLGVQRWVLTVHSGGDGDVSAAAMCYALNQG